MGDAAHATNPALGMGLNTALRDAQVMYEILKENQDVGYVSLIHHETTSGALNPLKEICHTIKEEIPEA